MKSTFKIVTSTIRMISREYESSKPTVISSLTIGTMIFLLISILFIGCNRYTEFTEITLPIEAVSPYAETDAYLLTSKHDPIYFVWTHPNPKESILSFTLFVENFIDTDTLEVAIDTKQALNWGSEVTSDELIGIPEATQSELIKNTLYAYKIPNDLHDHSILAHDCSIQHHWNWYVHGQNKFQIMPENKKQSFIFSLPQPDPPMLENPADAFKSTNAEIEFSWSIEESETHVDYTLELARDSDFENIVEGYPISALSDVSYQNQSAIAEGTYYWRVAAQDIDEACFSSWSDTRSFEIVACDAPVLYAGTEPNCDEEFKVAWSDTPNVTGYTVEIHTLSTFEGPPVFTSALDQETTSLTTSGLNPGAYYWRVKTIPDTYCAEKISDIEPLSFGYIPVFSLTDPPNTTTPPISSSSITFTWESLANTTYEFLLSTSSAFDTPSIIYSDTNAASGITPVIAYEEDQSYFWKVSATNDFGCTVESEYSIFSVSLCSLEITSPAEDYDTYFEIPTIEWSNTAAANYTVEIATDPSDFASSLVASTTTASTTWDLFSEGEYLQGNTFYVRVSDSEGCVLDAHSFIIRGFHSEADVISPTTSCNGSTAIPYGVTWVANKVYSGDSELGGQICSYNETDLSYIESHGVSNANFRYYGITRDLDNNRLFAGRLPNDTTCGWTMDRVTIMENLTGTPSISYKNCRPEMLFTIAFGNNRLFIGGSMFGCYNTQYKCSTGCPSGRSRILAWDMGTDSEAWHESSASWGFPAMWADDNRVYRNSSSTLIVDDATSSSYTSLFTMAFPESIGSVFRYNGATNDYLLIGQDSSKTLNIYRIENDPISASGDLVLVNKILGTPDRYNQGTFDTNGNIYFPGYSTKKIYKHLIYP